ncbi:MAG: efflux RND transporter periplasmic adaptor subunit [Myxococcales bacterium]|nr:efflux RND transporter periplasmic adaptor subunit [Myxococcales bacterium]
MKCLLALLLALPALAQERPPAPVTTAPATPARFAHVIEALGTVQGREAVTLTARVTEKVARVHFEDGQAVEAGTLLVELDHDELDARLVEAKARLAQHEAEWGRVRRLAKADMATASERDAQRALLETARAEVSTIEAQIADRRITAPFKGVLGLRLVSPGALVSPGTVVATLDDLASVWLDFPVPSVHLGLLAPGQAVEARAAAWPDAFTGQVTALDTRIDPATRQVKVRARLPNESGRLRPGLLMMVTLRAGDGEALSVPEGALSPIGNRQRVYVVVDGKATLREVKIGRRVPGRVEILEGLQAGEPVVVDGVHKLRPGAPVNVVSEAVAPAPASAP